MDISSDSQLDQKSVTVYREIWEKSYENESWVAHLLSQLDPERDPNCDNRVVVKV